MTSLQPSPGKNARAIPKQGVAPNTKDVTEPATPSAKKRAATGSSVNTENDSPTKKQRTKTVDHSKIPTCKEELTEADKLLLKLKKEGNSWTEITAAVSALTGKTYGKSSLSNRHARIANALFEWKDGDIERMLFVRKQVEEDTEAAIAAFKREAENKTWLNMAMAMTKIGADEYSAGAVEKMYKQEKRLGFPHQSTVEAVMASSSSSIPGGNSGDEQDNDDNDDGVSKDFQEEDKDEIVHSGEDEEVNKSEDDS